MAMDNPQVDNEELLQLAIRAVKSGQKEGARVMLRQLYSRDKRNETVMIWLAKVSRNQTERTKWLKQILEINPENETAQRTLAKMKYKQEAEENRTLLIFGSIAAVMVILALFVIVIAFAS